MGGEFIKLLFDKSLSITKRLSILIPILAILFFFDAKTGLFSTPLTKEKYETIQTLNTIVKDSSISLKIKEIARRDLAEMENKNDLHQCLILLGRKFNNAMNNITYDMHYHKPKLLIGIIRWVLFILFSSFSFIQLLILLKKFSFGGIVEMKNIQAGALSFVLLSATFSFLVIFYFNLHFSTVALPIYSLIFHLIFFMGISFITWLSSIKFY